MNETLKESERKLGKAERISHLAHWDRDLVTNVLTWSDGIYRILGLEPQKRKLQFAEFVKFIHPEDRARILKEVKVATGQLKCFHVAYRIIRPDGQLRYVQGDGEVIADDAGRPRRTIGFLQDVTEQHLAKDALANANRMLEARHAAMQEVLASIQAERTKFGTQVNKNVEEVILPLLQSLRQGATLRQQRAIGQIENCLREIVSPFLDNVAQAVKGLTPKELRVCSFIRQGLTAKQIADLEYVSPETIAAHRRNIRRKLQIAHRKINLTSYLRDAFPDSRAPMI